MKKLNAPWTDEQVAALNIFQNAQFFHPFTCHNRGDGKHIFTVDFGVLVAANNGWICPSCDYTQSWAYEEMITFVEYGRIT